MIPINLKLSNFTSYGSNPPELDFTKFKLAAISGLNGAGKSSLLDSVTWCLWGTSRAGDSADELIHLGTQEMSVDFSFELDDHIYTVKRKRVKKGGGSTSLELWSGDLSTHSIRSGHNLTEGTIKSTQQKIIDTLHLTFETFTNSAYLRQGHADEFTTKGPTERKKILADILGLDHYDLLEESAKEKAKDIQTRLTLLEYQFLEIETELSQKEEREKSLKLAEEEAKKAEKELAGLELVIKSIKEKEQQINLQVKSLEEKKEQLEKISKELSDIKIKIDLNQKSQQEYQGVLQQKQQIEENYQKLLSLLEIKKSLDEKRSELIAIKDELVVIQKIINTRENNRKDAVTKLELQIAEIQSKNNTLQQQNEQLQNKKNLCPTCGQIINAEKNEQIISSNLKKIAKSMEEINSLQKTIDKYQSVILPELQQAQQKEKIISSLEEETKSYFKVSEEVQKLTIFTEKFTKLQQAITGIKTHQDSLVDLQKIYEDRKKQIVQDENALKQLQIIEQDLLKIRNELTAKEQTKQELSQRAIELSGKAGEAKQLVSRVEQLTKLKESRSSEKDKLTEEKQIFDELTLAFGKKGIQAMLIEQAIPEIEEETNKLLDKLTEGRMKISLQTQKESKTKVLLSAGEKGYSTIETLEIVISDEMGQRSYELYSGGETFRVNFAIRLAISKLLTHRAGAKLQFLVIDEGFGTQDAPGRARLVEVLDTIKDDFEKILVITHIEELKEEFPVRIEVSKTTAGSTFEVVGV